MPGKKKQVKKVKAAPVKENPLYPNTPRNFRIGGAIRHQADLGRYVRWPKYIRIQRQRKILQQRLKVPPVINQFKNTLSKNEAVELFKLLSKYSPETSAAKKERIKAAGGAKAAGAKTGDAPPPTLKYGLKHVTYLIEQKKAKLVVIAHDVDPIELVAFLPTLCKRMDVPYVIVKGKGRVGPLVHKKNAAVVALTSVNSEDGHTLQGFADAARTQFNDNAEVLKKWGGGTMGLKTQMRLLKREKLLAAEAAKKAQY
jgi:large subunit ribosomal protein L7Ae